MQTVPGAVGPRGTHSLTPGKTGLQIEKLAGESQWIVLGVQPPSCGRMGKGGWIMEGDVKPGSGAEEEVLLLVGRREVDDVAGAEERMLLRVRRGGVDVVAGSGMTILVMLTWLTSTEAMRSMLFVVRFVVLFVVLFVMLFVVLFVVLFAVLFVVLFGKAVGWRKRLPDAVGVSASVLLLNGYGGAAVARVRTERKAGVRRVRIFAMFLAAVNSNCLRERREEGRI